MERKYNPLDIERKWQQRWQATGLYKAVVDESKPAYYTLTMYPYPSGDLHMGHWYAIAPSDARARWLRMKGYNVLFPIGFDSFGLPAENAAIKHSIHPKTWTYDNVERMRQQLRSMGTMFDWEREIITSDPSYYKWTQWFFLKLYEMGLAYKKIAPVDFCPHCNTTLAREQVWGEDRHCERCGTPVIKKDLNQWFFKITEYAEELLNFSKLEWPERVRAMQTNWIGRSEGAEAIFKSEQGGHDIPVFTTRPDTLWGATFMVLAPEHPLVEELTADDRRAEVEAYVARAERATEIERLALDKEKTGVFIGAYAINPVNQERIPIWIADYVLMGYGTGAIMAVPAHDERDFAFALKFGLPIIPVIRAGQGATKSYAMPGTMDDGFAQALQAAGVPFEESDGSLYVVIPADKIDRYLELAQRFVRADSWIEVVGGRWSFIFHDEVVELDSLAGERRILDRCHRLEPKVRGKRTVMEMLWDREFYRDVLYHDEYGTMIHSGEFDGTPGEEAVRKVAAWLAEKGIGKPDVNYRLHDWLISRQRYWGAPIPMIDCPACGIVPVPYEELPVLLPEDVQFMPTGESPLKLHEEFRHVKCPQCNEDAERETDTMDTFMCSSWYQYAYMNPRWKADEPVSADDIPFDPVEGAYWLPVDQYTGGIEHATMHLLYTRFFTKAMRDMKVVDFDEPMIRLYNQGIILGEDREKMSKSRGNVIAPDDLVQQYGADTVRGYLMFGFRWNQGGPWDSTGILGVQRFLERVWDLVTVAASASGEPAAAQIRALQRKQHQTIRKVSRDMEDFSFNTMIAALMEYTNYLIKAKSTPVVTQPAWSEAIRTLIILMAPSFPHLAEELWESVGGEYSVHQQAWPAWDKDLAAEEMLTIAVQVNGKVRDRFEAPADISEAEAKSRALATEGVQRFIDGKEPARVIYVPGRLVNIVVK